MFLYTFISVDIGFVVGYAFATVQSYTTAYAQAARDDIEYESQQK